MSDTCRAIEALTALLGDMGHVAVAVSGGVDSMTLALVAARTPELHTEIFHAVSPAVPPEATERVRRYAADEEWHLTILDAQEFADPDYMRNPVNRCFYCKSNLYGAIAPLTAGILVSGTNTDDLGDYRPGLQAARNADVRHPFVEVGIDKRTVRAIARTLDLPELAALPAAPCLASRVETGIPINAAALTIVHDVERELTEQLEPEAVRCRVRARRVVIELDEATLERLSHDERDRVRRQVATRWRARGLTRPVDLQVYRRGSAFIGVLEHSREPQPT